MTRSFIGRLRIAPIVVALLSLAIPQPAFASDFSGMAVIFLGGYLVVVAVLVAVAFAITKFVPHRLPGLALYAFAAEACLLWPRADGMRMPVLFQIGHGGGTDLLVFYPAFFALALLVDDLRRGQLTRTRGALAAGLVAVSVVLVVAITAPRDAREEAARLEGSEDYYLSETIGMALISVEQWPVSWRPSGCEGGGSVRRMQGGQHVQERCFDEVTSSTDQTKRLLEEAFTPLGWSLRAERTSESGAPRFVLCNRQLSEDFDDPRHLGGELRRSYVAKLEASLDETRQRLTLSVFASRNHETPLGTTREISCE